MTIGSRIRELRLSKGIAQNELATKVGISNHLLYKYENGIISNIPSDKLEKIASALYVSPAYLMGWEEQDEQSVADLDNIYPINLKKFRVLGEIACGLPTYADEQYETYVEASADIKADFCLIAKGDSMINARIQDGDVVFVKEQSIVENGQIAAVIINDEATLKRWYFYPDSQKLMLVAENPKYEPLVFIGKELYNVRCLGKAVCFTSYL